MALAQVSASADPFRQTVQSAARRFKSTWVELGKLLVKVRDGELHEAWGFESFEAYCSKELHIRKATALKLVRSFGFLARHEPKAVDDEALPQKAPAFEVVEVLADAEERGQLTDREYKDIRDSIWNPERSTAELKREFTERFPRPAAEPRPTSLTVRRLAQAARKLASELASCSDVPSAVADRAAALADDVEELAGRVKG
jgi:hypothetical protein